MQQKTNPIERMVEEYKVLILDGALATELEKHGCSLDDPLWSAKVLLENPDVIYRVHKDYFEAGADCAITASYQATEEGFLKKGIGREEAISLIKKTVELAKEARDEVWRKSDSERPKPLVAGSVGPYGAYLADGSEYTGDYDVTRETLISFHRSRIQALIEAGADVLAFETIPSFQEAEVLLSLLEDFPDMYAWLSFSLKNGQQISDGTELAKCAEAFGKHVQIASIGVNCAPADAAAKAIQLLGKHTQKPLIIYPNSGESYDATTKTWDGNSSCAEISGQSASWFEAGARLIGGCCRTNSDQIKQLAEKWRSFSQIETGSAALPLKAD
ncbi:homocysteine S-methyltransferase [Metabacillus sp. GX 13764]|uniref:homocysteine S-methyltransferase n=1 Tax=Metabacillus kandeliae TaxID=2900151 RepID=UPI001E31794E|nr:homocysteine S-methyltransferase [Metabacillus kandeliae]MCD7035403.1 homocysteine S-methyltransferase [Metabacillus kandeliae]